MNGIRTDICWTRRAREVRGPPPGWPGRSQTVAPAAEAAKGRFRALPAEFDDGGRGPPAAWLARCPCGLYPGKRPCGAGRRASSPGVITGKAAGNLRSARKLTSFRGSDSRRGAHLPGRPQGEAHISTERQEAGQEARLPAPHVDQGGPGHPVVTPAQGSSQPDGLIWSIRDRATFEALRRSGRRVRRGPITVTWLAGDPAEPPRVAYAIGRRAGGAVVRNRIRRRLRAITREVRAQLHPGAYLFGATAAAASLSYGDLRATVCQALRALHRP